MVSVTKVERDTGDEYTIEIYDTMYLSYGITIYYKPAGSSERVEIFSNPHAFDIDSYGVYWEDEDGNELEEGIPWTEEDWRETIKSEFWDLIDAYVGYDD